MQHVPSLESSNKKSPLQSNVPQAIVQCAQCRNLLTDSRALKQLFCVEEVVFIEVQFSTKQPARLLCAREQILLGVQKSFDAMSMFSTIRCSYCDTEVGRYYHSTTASLDRLRQRNLLFEDRLTCIDLDTCRAIEARRLLSNSAAGDAAAIQKTLLNLEMNIPLQATYDVKQSPTKTGAPATQKTTQQMSQTPERNEGTQGAQVAPIPELEYQQQMQKNMHYFLAVLDTLDVRVSESESLLEFVNLKVREIYDKVKRDGAI